MLLYSGDFLLYFLYLFFLVSEVISFTPDPRYGQTSNVIGTKLYYVGGLTKAQTSNEVFYLDLSGSFQVSSPPWVSMIESSAPIAMYDGTSITSPFDNSTIFLIGGFMKNPLSSSPDFNATVYAYNSNSGKWSTPSISGSIPTGLQEMQAAVNSAGKAYIFGGCIVTNYTAFTAVYYNNMNILDISANTWTYIQPTSSYPSVRADYTATLLSNGAIVYIGGWNGGGVVVDIKQLYLFNTTDLSWSSVNSTGAADLQDRRLHTAVLAENDEIIVYGGVSKNFSLVTPNLAVLNTSSYNWYIPSTSAGSNSPPPLCLHSANIYGNYMIVAFGFIADTQGTTTNFNPNVYFLNTKDHTWVNQFVALPTPTSSTQTASLSSTSSPDSSSTSKTSNSNLGLIIGLGVSLGILGLAGIFGLIFCLKRKRTHEKIIEIASEERSE